MGRPLGHWATGCWVVVRAGSGLGGVAVAGVACEEDWGRSGGVSVVGLRGPAKTGLAQGMGMGMGNGEERGEHAQAWATGRRLSVRG